MSAIKNTAPWVLMTNPHMNDSIFSYLEKLGETKIDFDFSRSEKLNSLFYQKIPVITVCGTNGKGSTCMFLEKILTESGYRVGTYMSPHVENIRERVRSDGDVISVEAMEEMGQAVLQVVKKNQIIPTYFEFLTFLAVHTFEQTNMDIAIFETGLGGRLDSTNSIPRIGAIMTTVSMDHMEFLGNTLTKIAREKIPVLEKSPFSICADQNREVLEMIDSKLKHTNLLERRHFFHSGMAEKFSYEQGVTTFGPISLGLRGNHQSSNASLAVTMSLYLRSIGWNQINVASIERGLEQTKNTARLEQWVDQNHHEIWVDVAHNIDSTEKLVQYLYTNRHISFETVFGCSADKPFEEMIESLKTITKEFHFVSTPTPRSWKPPYRLGQPATTIQSLIRQQKFPILCTGSFYHVGEIRKLLPNLGFSKN